MEAGARANRGLASYLPVSLILVMPGFMPGIHVFLLLTVGNKAWMAGTSPAMTVEGRLRESNYDRARGSCRSFAGCRAVLARRLRAPARHRSDHPSRHPLRRIEQFRRPAAQRLRGCRMRGEACRRIGAAADPAGTRAAKTVA